MYKIVFTRQSSKQYFKLEKSIQERIDDKLSILEKGDFESLDIKKMIGKENAYRMRVGDFRVIYQKEDEIITITILSLGNRKDVYK